VRPRLTGEEKRRIAEWLVDHDLSLASGEVRYDQLGLYYEAASGRLVSARAVRRVVRDLHRRGQLFHYCGHSAGARFALCWRR